MHETEKKPTGLKAQIKKYLCDPVLMYAVIAMISIMYHFCDTALTAVYGVVSFVIIALLFRLFDFMMKHRLIGTVAYLTAGFIFILTAMFSAEIGEDSYHISFGLWFMTPQEVLAFNGWYTFAIFLLFIFFMGSVIYYYTRVRYRIFMGFLVFIIPFTIYGKEAEQMPIILTILMSVGFIMLLIYFRELNDSDTVVIKAKRETWRSVGIFALLFAAVAAVVPKPKITADRSLLETLISAERFTDRLLEMVGLFQESSSGGQFRNVDDDRHLYYISADEELHLKNAAFSAYDFTSDTWNIGPFDSDVITEHEEFPIELGQAGLITKAILTAAELDSGFAELYGLTGYSADDIIIPEEGKATIHSAINVNEVVLVPQAVKRLRWTSTDEELEVLRNDIVRIDTGISYASFTFDYYKDTFFINGRNKEIVDIISGHDYELVLLNAMMILMEEAKSSYDDDIEEYAELISDEYVKYIGYINNLLDYGDSNRIYDLAQEITQGLDSDYEKAKAIEQYFYNNDYVYDLEYVKPRGQNVESFLFDSKRGVCFEYATSMVLLARAVGIPARYCQGFLVSEKLNNIEYQSNMVVTPKDAHGYPELYIEGFGWVTFEPTISSSRESGENEKGLFEMLMIAGIILFGLLILLLIFIRIYPLLSHKLFVIRYRKKAPEAVVKAVMYRLCRIYDISGVNTSHEAAREIMRISNADISLPADLFDAVVYGEASVSGEDREKVLNIYISAYEAYRETKKKRRIKTA